MVKAFLVLLVQKFMSIVIAKVSLYGEFPLLKDSSFLLLLGIHFLSFTLFHTRTGEEVMDRINKSEIRIVVQETFKGYGKGSQPYLTCAQGNETAQQHPILHIRPNDQRFFLSHVQGLVCQPDREETY
jgi:hypothetical protein